MKALDEYEAKYGKLRHPETGALKPGVELVVDTDEEFVVNWHDKLGRPLSMGYKLCKFIFWRNQHDQPLADA